MTVHSFNNAPQFQPDASSNQIPGTIDGDLVLASTSASLRRLLEASGLAVRVAPPDHEEMNALQALLGSMPEHDAADVAELHVRMRVDSAVAQFPGALIFGAHRVVSLNGRVMEAPRTFDAARDLLLDLRGETHQVHSAVALAEEGRIIWSSVDTAQVRMRPVSAEFIGRYLSAAGAEAVGSPGAYNLDGVGLQLIDHIEGTYPAGLGVPLFALFEQLRKIGFMVS